MSKVTTFESDLRVGDWITIPARPPRWWQFWKRWPFPQPPRTYRVTSVTASTITIDD